MIFQAVFPGLVVVFLCMVGEMTVQNMSNTWSTNHALNKTDVKIYKKYVETHLVSSKTDSFGRGLTIE